MKAPTNRRALDWKRPGRRARDRTPRFDNHRLSRRRPPMTCYLCQPRDGAHGRPSSVPANSRRGWEGQRRVTPRQTCPRPNGFGRNLRSKTRWFTGFCNSHQVSHFATFFIDARAEISVAESRLDILKTTNHPRSLRLRGRRGDALSFKFLGAIHADVQYARRGQPSGSAEARHTRLPFPG